MAVKDYLESEVAVAVAVTAAVFSPRVRRVVRRGVVYGVAGVLKAGDAISAAAQSAALAAQQPAATAGTETATALGTTGTGNALSAVARSAVDTAQQVAASVVHTVQDVTEEAKARREGDQDPRLREVNRDA